MTTLAISCPSAEKARRGRRKGSIGTTARAIREAVVELTGRYERMTVRQVFYALEVAGTVEKTERGYRQVQTQLLEMRREGQLDWGFITDGTRWQRKPSTWDSAEDYIESVARHYRRDLWRGQDTRIEMWLEKDALADVVVDVTEKWDVSLMVSRGQSSATFLHSAAKTAEHAYELSGAETFVYTLYDFDAGGERAARTIARDLVEHAPGVPIHVKRLAVTPSQITAWNLPMRPAKRSDPEAGKFGEVAVELDAIPPDLLVGLVENAITSHIDARMWEIQQVIEREERAGLLAIRDSFIGGVAA